MSRRREVTPLKRPYGRIIVSRRRERPGDSCISSRSDTTTKEPSSLLGLGTVLSIMNKAVNSVPGVIAKPITNLKESLFSSDHEDEGRMPVDDGAELITLEGMLYYKKGGRGRPFKWKRRFVRLDMADGGSISCFKAKDEGAKKMLRQMYTTLNLRNEKAGKGPTREEDICLRFPSDLPWVVKDLYYDPRMFAIEVPTSADAIDEVLLQVDDEDDEGESIATEMSSSAVHIEPSLTPVAEDIVCELSAMEETELESQLADDLQDEIIEAQQHNKKRLRYYFKCMRTGNEKALWLKCFAKIDRMSNQSSRKGKVIGSLSKAVSSSSRIRSATSASFARETRQLDRMFSDQPEVIGDALKIHNTPSGREFRVVPTYAYPHRWMTSAELREEMLLPSSHFHDLRVPSKRDQEIGTLKVEVLQCLGLPKMDRVSETDAVCYLVCGSYAFATDVINDCASPMWPRKTRRACIFPLFDGYARLYVGVFDDDGVRAKDDLVGRVAIDISRLRPGSQYDVTLPLRMSTHVYSRRKRGSIRLRFTLDWKSEKRALLSYLPKQMPTVKTFQEPNTDVTVMCCDEKAFRNVAVTVHGVHLPGRFSPKHFRALLREINFTRKLVMIMLRTQVKDMVLWENPTISAFVFCAWMHCIYTNRFSLAPAYLIIFLIIHLVQNYAKYGVDGPSQLGFVPVSYEEMLLALIRGDGARCFAPLELQYVGPNTQNVEGATEYVSKTHEAWGKKELRWIGLGPTEEELEAMNVEEEHMEFAFAKGKDYPRFTVEESLVARPSKAKSKKKGRSAQNGSLLTGASSQIFRGTSGSPSNDIGPLDDDMLLVFEDDIPTDSWMNTGSDRDIPRTGSGDLLEEVFDTLEASEYEHKSFEMSAEAAAAYAKLPPSLRIPQQDMDKAGGAGNDKSILEDITEVKMKLHDLTLQQFNDQAYTIRDPDVVYFGQSDTRKRKTDENVERQLDKLLGLGQYSSGNMITSKISPYVEPIVGGANSFICLFRALFNIFTWRDPFLSFWVTILGSILAAILFVFPWRIVMFVAGFVLFGPQNWIYRVVKERKDEVSEIARESRPDAPSTDLTVETVSDSEEDKSAGPSLPSDQPVFQGHGEPNQRPKELDPSKVNPREVHHVVVPYSRLKYQRMYDWPPEPKYARVKIPPPKPPSSRKSPASPTSIRRKSFFVTSADSLPGVDSPISMRRGRSQTSSGEASISISSRRSHAYSGHSRHSVQNSSIAAFEDPHAKKKV